MGRMCGFSRALAMNSNYQCIAEQGKCLLSETMERERLGKGQRGQSKKKIQVSRRDRQRD
jgi:hypothetical protein